jgi:N-acetylmuramoyl-L-alanine amidase
MCDDHPAIYSANQVSVTRRQLVRGALTIPLAVPALIGLTANRASADVKIRSRACSGDGQTPSQSKKTLGDLFVAHGLQVHPRSDWGAKLPAKGPLEAETPRFLLVHHTVSANTYAASAVPGIIQGFFGFHTGKEKGWNDVAYNFFVDRFGGVWEARTGSLAGAVRGDATGGNQGFSQLVCMIGDFSKEAPTPEAVKSLSLVLAALGEKYGIDTSPGMTASFVSRKSNRWKAGVCVETPTISGHREMSQTTCPGDALFAVVRDDLAGLVTKVRKK